VRRQEAGGRIQESGGRRKVAGGGGLFLQPPFYLGAYSLSTCLIGWKRL